MKCSRTNKTYLYKRGSHIADELNRSTYVSNEQHHGLGADVKKYIDKLMRKKKYVLEPKKVRVWNLVPNIGSLSIYLFML